VTKPTPPNPNRIPWIPEAGQSPVCDVPWIGTLVVLSDGSVNFCCNSSAIVGNVNHTPFAEIWNGPELQEIRQSLAEQRLPPQCQTSSCPFHRGDPQNSLYDRMEGDYGYRKTSTSHPHAEIYPRFAGSLLRLSDSLHSVGEISLNLDLQYNGPPLMADLFVSLKSEGGALRFLPECEEFAVPWAARVSLETGALQVTLWTGRTINWGVGQHEVCVAWFVADSNPNLLANCYWSQVETFQID
jgi:hypothetical protein